VFQFDKDDFAGDAQLINSVYFDNENLELYHGRLDKKPNAIAARIRQVGAAVQALSPARIQLETGYSCSCAATTRLFGLRTHGTCLHVLWCL
jgi:SPX domain protein involved in polyphosphate accumulation